MTKLVKIEDLNTGKSKYKEVIFKVTWWNKLNWGLEPEKLGLLESGADARALKKYKQKHLQREKWWKTRVKKCCV